MAHVQRIAKPAKPTTKWPMADLSPEAQAERIRKHPPPLNDHTEVHRRASGLVIQFNAAVFGALFFGVVPKTSPAETKE